MEKPCSCCWICLLSPWIADLGFSRAWTTGWLLPWHSEYCVCPSQRISSVDRPTKLLCNLVECSSASVRAAGVQLRTAGDTAGDKAVGTKTPQLAEDMNSLPLFLNASETFVLVSWSNNRFFFPLCNDATGLYHTKIQGFEMVAGHRLIQLEELSLPNDTWAEHHV